MRSTLVRLSLRPLSCRPPLSPIISFASSHSSIPPRHYPSLFRPSFSSPSRLKLPLQRTKSQAHLPPPSLSRFPVPRSPRSQRTRVSHPLRSPFHPREGMCHPFLNLLPSFLLDVADSLSLSLHPPSSPPPSLPRLPPFLGPHRIQRLLPHHPRHPSHQKDQTTLPSSPHRRRRLSLRVHFPWTLWSFGGGWVDRSGEECEEVCADLCFLFSKLCGLGQESGRRRRGEERETEGEGEVRN